MRPQTRPSGLDPEDGEPFQVLPGQWAPRMSEEQFDYFRHFAKHHAGISLPGHKRNMVYRRVSKRLAALGLKDFGDYRALLLGPNADAELQHLVNALTTNKTEFFRESHHFDHLLATVLPWLRKRAHGNPKLRIWSAGCSSGQEPYSIAMTLCGALADMSRWDAKILGTDIDTDMIERGRRGAYSHAEMLSLPGKFLSRYIEPVAGPGGRGRLAEAVRSLVTFNQLNLHGPWPMKAKFDAIFCRNVIIYFDAVDQSRLFNRFADHLHEGGYVYIGHSESLYRVTERFQPLGQSIYQRIA